MSLFRCALLFLQSGCIGLTARARLDATLLSLLSGDAETSLASAPRRLEKAIEPPRTL